MDNKRMEVLFSPFRARDTNPEGWDLKMNFWTNVINKWCLQQRKAVFTIDDVRKAFERGDQHPHIDCLKLVISHMKRRLSVLLSEDLPVRKNAKSLSRNVASWAVNSFLVKPISLGWGLFASNPDEPDMSHEEKALSNIATETKLFNKETLEILVETVECHLKNMKSTCMRYENFFNMLNKSVFAEKTIDLATFEVVTDVIETKGKVKILDEPGVRIIKFGRDIEISLTDITLIRLEATKEILEAETCKLSEEMDALREEARLALTNKSRDKALLLLKRKKRIEAKMDEKDTQIDNIEMIYQQLLDSDSQQSIVKAFQLANTVLKRQSANLDEIEDTVASVEDTLGDIASRTSEISRPISTDTATIEFGAEEELDEILKDIEAENEAAQTKNSQASNQKTDALLKQLSDLTVMDNEFSSDSIEQHQPADQFAQWLLTDQQIKDIAHLVSFGLLLRSALYVPLAFSILPPC